MSKLRLVENNTEVPAGQALIEAIEASEEAFAHGIAALRANPFVRNKMVDAMELSYMRLAEMAKTMAQTF